jgi:hypothetical protein
MSTGAIIAEHAVSTFNCRVTTTRRSTLSLYIQSFYCYILSARTASAYTAFCYLGLHHRETSVIAGRNITQTRTPSQHNFGDGAVKKAIWP